MPSWRGTGGGYVPVAASGQSPEHPCSRRGRASVRARRLGSAGLRGGTARGRCGGGLCRSGGHDDAIAVLFDRTQPDALHLRQLLGALERSVGLAVGDDGLGLGGADVVQHAIERGGVGGVDVDLLAGQRAAGQQQGQRQRREQCLDLVHVGSPGGEVGFLAPGALSAAGKHSLLRRGARRHRRRRCSDTGLRRTRGSENPYTRPPGRIGVFAPELLMDASKIDRYVSAKWDDEIVPQLIEYIRIPNKSPMFDADWEKHGYMADAVKLMESWARAQPIPGMQVEVVQLEGRTPLIYIEIPAAHGGSDDDCVLLYGHLDKQPEMTGWDNDLGPWKPVLRGERLYGRGGADDGYAIYGSLAAVMALHEQQLPHSRCVVLIEACEESGSYDLPAYVDHLADRIGKPSLVVCLD